MIKHLNSANCQIPQTLTFGSQVHRANIQLVTYLCITSPKSKKMQILFSFANPQDKAKTKNCLTCACIDIKPHPHPRTVWCMEKYWGCTILDQEGGFHCSLQGMQQFPLHFSPFFCTLWYLGFNSMLFFNLGIFSNLLH